MALGIFALGIMALGKLLCNREDNRLAPAELLQTNNEGFAL